jgi:ATP-dependent Clp protease protease subunit
MDNTQDEEAVSTQEEVELTEEELVELLKESMDPSDETWSPTTLKYFGKKNRTILLTGDIDDEVANALGSQIRELNLADPAAPIIVHINTSGGSIIDALAIYDMLKCVTNPIVTIVNGGCMSAGLLIASAGSRRIATPNSMYFYHQTVVQVAGIDSTHVMKSTADFYDWCNETVNKLMRDGIGMSAEDWDTHFGHSTSKYFDAKEAMIYGFVTDLMSYPEKPIVELSTDGEEEE